MDYTEAILTVLGIVSALITGILIPFVRSKMSADQLSKLDYWTKVLIAAAETKYNGVSMGQQKKEWVLAELANLGLKFDVTAVSNAIDGICKQLTATEVINTNKA